VVNDLKQLLRDNVADAPTDHLDVAALLGIGRRRVRRRRTAVAGLVASATAGVVIGAASISGIGPGTARPDTADQLPRLHVPTLHLSDAEPAVVGTDYREIASHTNDDLEADNGQRFDGVTDDGLILFRDGSRYALVNPATDEKDWLPETPDTSGRTLGMPVELGADRLVLLGLDGGAVPTLFAYVFDRGAGQWSVLQWPGLPSASPDDLPRGVVGPDDRLYVLGPRGSDPDGKTYELWSASLTDQKDVRDEALSVGDLAFTDTSMVWTDSTNDDAGMVHVRDLATGEETSFDPQVDKRCNLLTFGATDDRIVMGQYCGTDADGVRDDRVQILSTDGDQVVTIQNTDIQGSLDGTSSDVVTVSSSDGDRSGTYVYDLGSGRFLRISDRLSSWGQETGVAAGNDQFIWYTPEGRHGATQHLGQLLP
jgi:hypothetical protein